MNKLLTIILLVILTGCASTPIKDAIITDKTVVLDARYYEECMPLVELKVEDSLLDISIRNIEIYADCKDRQRASILLLKKFSNFKEPK